MTFWRPNGEAPMKTIDFIYRYDPANPGVNPPPGDAAAARRLLESGNRLFARWADNCKVEGEVSSGSTFVVPCNPQDLGLPTPHGKAAKQAPFAVLLGCSDARVPAELLFGQVRNNLFVIRVAGNVLSDECLGSVEYALHHLGEGLRIIVVLGHTNCGAVSATVDTYLNPWSYLARAASHSLRSIVDRIFVPVRKAANAMVSVWGANVAQLPGYRSALIESAVFLNTVQAAYNLRLELERAGKSEIQVVYGVFDLVTHRVKIAPGRVSGDAASESTLADAPADLAAFEELAIRMVRNVTPSIPSLPDFVLP